MVKADELCVDNAQIDVKTVESILRWFGRMKTFKAIKLDLELSQGPTAIFE
jgi:hypothetical protein